VRQAREASGLCEKWHKALHARATPRTPDLTRSALRVQIRFIQWQDAEHNRSLPLKGF